MQWILDDIGKPEWEVDVLNSNFRNELKLKALKSLSGTDKRDSYIEKNKKNFTYCLLKMLKKE
jgi:hypothetical protein